jgi:hypothetical protein
LIFLGVIQVLIAVSTTVFFPAHPSLIAMRLSMSVELVSSNPFSRHNGGSLVEISQEA